MRTWAPLLIGAAVYALGVAWAATVLPAAGVVLHFDAGGAADRVGSRGSAVATLVVLGAGMVAVGIAMIAMTRRAPLRMLNIPHREYWTEPRRQPRLRTMLTHDVSGVIGATLVFLTLVPVWMVLGTRAPVTAALIWAPTALFALGMLIWATRLARRRYRPADGAGRHDPPPPPGYDRPATPS